MSKHQDVSERIDDRRAELKAAAQLRADARAEAIVAAKARAEALAAQKSAARAAAAEEARVKAEARAAAQAEARTRATSAAAPASDTTGKQRLIDAAMRLHREKRSFASLGIREIAREAHLNPNTFYRHFESIDDLAVAAVMQCGDRLRPMLHQIRTLASRVDPVSVAALEVSAFYAFALGNMDAFVVGVTEYHGGSDRVREAISALLRDVASEMRDDIAELALFPSISREHLDIACTQIVVHLFHLSQEYIEKPERRAAIIEASECMIVWMIAGAALGTPANITTMLAPLVGR
jgi:AcrR family transcriptional regulator